MTKFEFKFSVDQTFPDEKLEHHVLSESVYFENFSLSPIFSSFEHQVRSWLEHEAQTDSSFRFNFEIVPF